MKTLYISDLDGTLLNKNITVSKFSENTLNTLIKKGMHFTVATARTSSTAVMIMQNVKLALPIVLMNGAIVYDVNTKTNIAVELINEKSAMRIFEMLKEQNLSGFLYTNNKKGVLNTYYENLDTNHRKNFYNERTKKFGKVFIKIEKFEDCIDKDILYFSTCDKKDNLINLYNNLKKDELINIEFYRDIYLEDYWYLEISSYKASKFNAVNYLKKKFGFDEIISFGDNFNDIPMFKASKYSYAVENAKKLVKESATSIINSNEDDGVAKFLIDSFNKDTRRI